MQAILALDLPFKPLLADVCEGSNGAALFAARRWCAGLADGAFANAAPSAGDNRFVLCWGGQGVGKSMLAQAVCAQTDSLYLHPASPLGDFTAAMDAPAVVLDGVDVLNPAQAIAAFNLYNHIRDSPHKHWWATSRVPPSHMNAVLPDLASRMAWGLVFELLPLADADSIRVLQAQAARLGFALPSEAAQYLLLRLERNLGALAQHMGSLNRYALMLKKPVTVHLVQQWYATVYVSNGHFYE